MTHISNCAELTEVDSDWLQLTGGLINRSILLTCRDTTSRDFDPVSALRGLSGATQCRSLESLTRFQWIVYSEILYSRPNLAWETVPMNKTQDRRSEINFWCCNIVTSCRLLKSLHCHESQRSSPPSTTAPVRSPNFIRWYFGDNEDEPFHESQLIY